VPDLQANCIAAWVASECPLLGDRALQERFRLGRPGAGGFPRAMARDSSAQRPSAGLLALATQGRPAEGEDVSVSGIGQALRGLAQRLGGTRLGVLAIGRIVSPLQRQLYRRTGGRLSLTGRAPVLLLTTTGRRTGKARTIPLLYLRDGARLVICNVNPGFERPNPWVVNLRAQPHAQAQIGRSTTSMTARPASDDELDRY